MEIRIAFGVGTVKTFLYIIIEPNSLGVGQYKHTVMAYLHCPTPFPRSIPVLRQSELGSMMMFRSVFIGPSPRRVCQEFCPRGEGGHVWQGCMHGRECAWWGTYMAGGMCGKGHAWQGVGGVHGRGACIAGGGGMHGRGCAWQVGCAWQDCAAWQILRDVVNERVVHILLECILVFRSVSTEPRMRQLGSVPI